MMVENSEITQEQINNFFNKLKKESEEAGYYLNPDEDFTKAVLRGLLQNEARYGYMACPCRLAKGAKNDDKDIICPCDYRDADLNEFDTCYCGLYVTQKILKGEKSAVSIPDRRLNNKKNLIEKKPSLIKLKSLPYPVWRCKVCGYLCARENPPENCPICKVTKERFEKFIVSE